MKLRMNGRDKAQDEWNKEADTTEGLSLRFLLWE